jgi:DNA-binding beta-propeller fold protein YncE
MKSSRSMAFALSLFALMLGASALVVSAAGNYRLIKKLTLETAPGDFEYFDYINVDSAARRVYISAGTQFFVIDADKLNVVGTVAGMKKNHGVALAPEFNRGFITDGDAGQIVVFDLKTLKTTGQIPAEKGADSIFYDPASKRLFVFQGSGKSATVIDAAKQSVIATLPLGGAPEQGVVDGKGMIYDNLESTNEVVAIDTHDLKIKARWPVAPAGHPVSIAMDPVHRRLFIGGRDPKMLVVMDADSGKIIGEPFPIGDRVDTNVFDPSTSTVMAATREGILHIFHEDSPDKLSVVENVKTEFGAKTMGFDSKTHRVYLSTSDFGPVPAPTDKQPNPQPTATPGTLRMLVYGR